MTKPNFIEPDAVLLDNLLKTLGVAMERDGQPGIFVQEGDFRRLAGALINALAAVAAVAASDMRQKAARETFGDFVGKATADTIAAMLADPDVTIGEVYGEMSNASN